MVRMVRLSNMVHGLMPAVLMVVVQVATCGVNVLYKLAVNDGMSLRIIIAYRFLFATAFMAPVAVIIERKNRPKVTWTILFQAFLSGLFGGSLAQNLYVESLALTSATFAAAMTNLVPPITFILAVSFGLERVGLRSLTGKAKVLGTLLGMSGAILLTLYKGPKVEIWSTHVDLLEKGGHLSSSSRGGNIGLGSLMAVGSCVCYAIWLIVQAKMSETYPFPYSSTALMCSIASIQASAFSLCVERDWAQWRLGWNIRLFTVAFAGIVASGLTVTLISWCVRKRGPLFVSIFNPLMLLLVAIAGSLVLNEKLHLGSIIGGILIVLGLYVVLWSKSKELKSLKQQQLLTPSKTVPQVDNIQIIVTCNSADDKPPVEIKTRQNELAQEEELQWREKADQLHPA